MEIQLRLILLVVGLLILLGVAIDIYRRRPLRQGATATYTNSNSNELLQAIAHRKAPAVYQDSYDEQFSMSELEPIIDPYVDDLQDTFSEEILEIERSEIPKTVVEPPPVSDVIAVHIMSRAPAGFEGEQLYNAISNAHFYLGANNIFNRHENDDGTGAVLFSLVKAVEPGYFDIDILRQEQVPGVTMLLVPSKLNDPLVALDKLVRAAKQIAFVLNGEMLDHTRQALTLTTIESYKKKLDTSISG